MLFGLEAADCSRYLLRRLLFEEDSCLTVQDDVFRASRSETNYRRPTSLCFRQHNSEVLLRSKEKSTGRLHALEEFFAGDVP